MSNAAPAIDPAVVRQRILQSVQGRIPRVAVSLGYRLGLAVVAVAMILLPLIYVGLVGLIAAALVWHATQNIGVFEQAEGRAGARGAFVIYFIPLVAGAILLFFMIKPLFARPGKGPPTLRLTPGEQPLLFQHVANICQAVGAPVPREISVDCDVNASASFRRGLISLFGRDLRLTIGLPLVAGLSLRQFSGVLAHEFGHFAQGAALRLTYVIRSTNFWFMRVVYERDAWDERLVVWSQQLGERLGLVLLVARLFVWLTRRVLWVLMTIGHAISCFMLRQMEFDADRYEARLAGSECFASTAVRLESLSLAYQAALGDLSQFWAEGRLADNLAGLVLVKSREIPPEILAKLDKARAEAKTGAFDTHPATNDRIASAVADQSPGIFQIPGDSPTGELPATLLFSNLLPLSKQVSLEFYRTVLGPQVKPELLHSTQDLLRRQSSEREADQALGRFFQGQFSLDRAPQLAEGFFEPSAEPRQTAERVRSARQRMLASLDEYRTSLGQYHSAVGASLQAMQAAAAIEAKLKIRPAEFRLTRASVAEAAEIRGHSRAVIAQLAPRMATFEDAAAERLTSALKLLHVPKVLDRIAQGAPLRDEVASLIPAFRCMTARAAELVAIRERFLALVILCQGIEGNNENQSLVNSITKMMKDLRTLLWGLSTPLAATLYPFDHANRKATLRDYAVPALPEEGDLGGLMSATNEALDKLWGLYGRLYARLAFAAEQVEDAIGLPRLADPPPESDA